MKLTKPQAGLLATIAKAGERGTTTFEGYKPAIKLVELGLAQWERPTSYGFVSVTLTDAGREALAALEKR